MTEFASSALLMLFGAVAGAMVAVEFDKRKKPQAKTAGEIFKAAQEGDPFVRSAFLSYGQTMGVVAKACDVMPENSTGPYQLFTLEDGSKMLLYRVKQIEGNVVRLKG